jgi:hypothetical protein
MRPSDLLMVLLIPLFACGARPPPEPARAPDDGRMGVHGMVLFGETRRYMSHIPMFRRPHDAQIILEVDLPGASASRAYADGLYTFEPERFALDALARGQRTTFRGTIYKGSFEDGGTPIAKDVTVRVKRVLDARFLNDASGAGAAGRYLLLGEPRDAYLVRRIEHAPGIDQIVRATVTGGTGLDEARLARGIEVTIEGRGEAPLVPGEKLRAVTPWAVVGVETGAVLSCLVGPDFDKRCP